MGVEVDVAVAVGVHVAVGVELETGVQIAGGVGVDEKYERELLLQSKSGAACFISTVTV